jgi:hypothetical protein
MSTRATRQKTQPLKLHDNVDDASTSAAAPAPEPAAAPAPIAPPKNDELSASDDEAAVDGVSPIPTQVLKLLSELLLVTRS